MENTTSCPWKECRVVDSIGADSKEEHAQLVNLVLGADALLLTVILVMASIAPLPEENTHYVYADSKDIPRNPNNDFGVLGSTLKTSNETIVTIDKDLPPLIKNVVLRHENCHVAQSANGRNMASEEDEMECYMRMFVAI